MSKIIYVDYKQLEDDKVLKFLKDFPQHNWSYISDLRKMHHGIESEYVRVGCNNLFFKNDIVDLLDLAPPEYCPNYRRSFSDITDQRCHELWQESNKPWLVFWSGGADSTLILSSIIKNLSTSDRDRVTVACNHASIYENPRFYNTFVKPNFKLIDSSTISLSEELLSQYIVIDGSPADQLHAGFVIQKMLYENSDHVLKNCHSDPDLLLGYLSQKTNDQFATWYYERVIESAKSQPVPVETYHDFFWWVYFNWFWVTVKLRPLFLYQPNLNQSSLQSYLDNFKMWFDTADYQQWAMNNNHSGEKFGNHLGQYKFALKKYIYEVDRDEYYFNFKTKMESMSRPPQRIITNNFFCILDDFTTLKWPQDCDRIFELLSAHII